MSEKKETRAQTLKKLSSSSLEETYQYMLSKNTHVAAAAANRAMSYDVETDSAGIPLHTFFTDLSQDVNEAPQVLREFITNYWGYFEKEGAALLALDAADKAVAELSGPYANAELALSKLPQEELASTPFTPEELEVLHTAKKARNDAKEALNNAVRDRDKVRSESNKALVPAWVKRIRRYAVKLAVRWDTDNNRPVNRYIPMP